MQDDEASNDVSNGDNWLRYSLILIFDTHRSGQRNLLTHWGLRSPYLYYLDCVSPNSVPVEKYRQHPEFEIWTGQYTTVWA